MTLEMESRLLELSDLCARLSIERDQYREALQIAARDLPRIIAAVRRCGPRMGPDGRPEAPWDVIDRVRRERDSVVG